ncbi:hypothetical protein BN2475_10011 [Paraburkholderia ribeironis]|uniref:Uncharacterized protein n=1 Tax=Paraburkholderia ribeironis TaxID=1247936 RepID=A0A1N7RIE2_9BURK|nr:hypothetical protein [Paraburkholderia ribeironis]SIT34855.1 hypothetical protein BN2475_10011 [Paraburkholderia ribeironis]
MTDIQTRKQQARAILAGEKRRNSPVEVAEHGGLTRWQYPREWPDDFVISRVDAPLAFALNEAGEFDAAGMLKP